LLDETQIILGHVTQGAAGENQHEDAPHVRLVQVLSETMQVKCLALEELRLGGIHVGSRER
jgi:hypothetical protein